MKTCKKCNESKDLSEFYAHPHTKDRLQAYCKSCGKLLSREFTVRNPGYHRKRNYGLTEEKFANMVREQLNLCAICKTEMTRPHVDHDHKTERVRGLLCNHCNLGLGHFFDNPKLLNSASQYLVLHGD